MTCAPISLQLSGMRAPTAVHQSKIKPADLSGETGALHLHFYPAGGEAPGSSATTKQNVDANSAGLVDRGGGAEINVLNLTVEEERKVTFSPAFLQGVA